MTDLTQNSGNPPGLAASFGTVRWSWFGEFVTPKAHVHTEREVREARQRAAQSVVERLTR